MGTVLKIHDMKSFGVCVESCQIYLVTFRFICVLLLLLKSIVGYCLRLCIKYCVT